MAGTGEEEDVDLLRLYRDDSRTPCKYGAKCYQKNPLHHEKYKHPPDKHKLDTNDESEESAKKTKHSDTDDNSRAEDENLGCSTNENKPEMTLSDDLKEAIKQAFLVDMPNDFYSFWSFCLSLKKNDPAGALKEVGLLLVGPFDFMAGQEKFKNFKQSDYLRHWRYYYDPPEFQTILKGDDTLEFHVGYYRDDPFSDSCFVASNSSAVDCIIMPMAENLFGAVNSYLDSRRSKANPFQQMKINSLQKSLQSWAKGNNFDLDVNTPAMKTRSRKVVAKTFHKGGIVVTVNKTNDTGYRPLIETEANLKRILKNYAKSDNDTQRKTLMNQLQPIITAANIANDECDFGTSLELGIDLFSFGGEMFHGMIKHLLCTAYSLLNREPFSEIIKAHLEKRQKGAKLSIIQDDK